MPTLNERIEEVLDERMRNIYSCVNSSVFFLIIVLIVLHAINELMSGSMTYLLKIISVFIIAVVFEKVTRAVMRYFISRRLRMEEEDQV